MHFRVGPKYLGIHLFNRYLVFNFDILFAFIFLSLYVRYHLVNHILVKYILHLPFEVIQNFINFHKLNNKYTVKRPERTRIKEESSVLNTGCINNCAANFFI